ncbi:Smr/MutS family protein [Pseudomonas aeruginosa]|uniref:Smr/MutS family protein n=1 Tax=Pseudomonas aeruginosa TaxID=287 RepID=UPI003CF123D2
MACQYCPQLCGAWLTEFDDVQAYCTALPHHGGSGACYVALRKTAQAKQENWERHAKRSR